MAESLIIKKRKRPHEIDESDDRSKKPSRISSPLKLIKRELQSIQFKTDLDDIGVCILDNFLNNSLSMNIEKITKTLYRKYPSLFKDSGCGGNGMTGKQPIPFRGDLTCWVTKSELFNRCYTKLYESFDDFIKRLIMQYQCSNTQVYFSHKSKIQIACFPAGSHGYKLHADNPNNNGRLLTLIYYANNQYDQKQDGGWTRYYVNNGTKFIDVEPKPNRLVAHWSDLRVLKQTVPCKKKVFSFTTWYFGEQAPLHIPS